MKALKSILMLIAVGLIFTAWSTPVEKVLQNGLEGYAGCADALVFSKAGYETITYGTHDSLKIYWSSSWGNPTSRVLIKFDLSPIPNTATISNAKLSLYTSKIAESCCSPGVMMAQGTKYVNKISATWSENTVNWNNKPATATSTLAQCTNKNVQAWEDFDVTSTVKTMLTSPSTNYGFSIKCAENAEFGILLRSSQYTEQTYRPKLIVTYEVGSGILPQKILGKITPAKEYKIAVYSLQGKEIASHKIKDISVLNKMLPAGVNIVKINGQKVKIVKNK